MPKSSHHPSIPQLETVEGAPSWRFGNDCVDACVTQQGGHLAPVTFRTPAGDIQPFSIAPWGTESLPPDTPDLLKTLRGDFFCAPFGGNGTPWRGEAHPPHGETASAVWQSPRLSTPATGRLRFEADITPTVRAGRVSKSIEVCDGETNLYLRHTLAGFTGPMSLGHHAMLKCPAGAGRGHIGLSPFKSGRVLPDPFESPVIGGYSTLKPGATFQDLQHVPLLDGSDADLSRYPAREGFDDLVMVTTKPRSTPAWSTLAFPDAGYLWFSLRDPSALASTILWFSNGGRHYAPWNGRHRGVIGIEDVTSHFHYGLAESVKNHTQAPTPTPTIQRLTRRKPMLVNYIMGVVPLPPDFDRVKTVRFGDQHVTFVAESGSKVRHAVDHTFLAAST